jgi:hypothetical protein
MVVVAAVDDAIQQAPGHRDGLMSMTHQRLADTLQCRTHAFLYGQKQLESTLPILPATVGEIGKTARAGVALAEPTRPVIARIGCPCVFRGFRDSTNCS